MLVDGCMLVVGEKQSVDVEEGDEGVWCSLRERDLCCRLFV